MNSYAGGVAPFWSAILTFHSLDRSGQLFSTSPEVFRMQVGALLEARIPIVPLEQIQQVDGAVAFTLDDGYRNVLDHAIPLLTEFRLPATMFVGGGYVGRAGQWRSDLPRNSNERLLTWLELRDLARAGVRIGAHTVSHANLVDISESQAADEMRQSRQEIEDRLGEPVRTFAYPYGYSSPPIRSLAAREFDLACGTELAMVGENADPFNLPRIFEFYLRSRFWLSRPTRPVGSRYVATRRWITGARAVFSRTVRSCI